MRYRQLARYARVSGSAVGLLLLLFIGAAAAANAILPDRPFSEAENRVLEQRPPFSLRSLLAGPFIADYERYIADQFALRDVWVGMKTSADRILGKTNSNGVFLGKGGYLIESYRSPSDEELMDRVRAIGDFGKAASGLSIYVMVTPTAASLLSSKLPAYAPVGDQQADLERLRRRLPQSVRFVDVYAALDAIRDEKPIFYKTDHHWTTAGAYYAYRELCRQMGIMPQGEDAFDIRQATDAFYGSLYSKSGFRRLQPDRIELYKPKPISPLRVEYMDEGRIVDSLYAPDRLDGKDKYAVFLNGNHARVRITTDGPKDQRLLVIKDSYANSLIPFLTNHFGEIDVVDLRYADESIPELVRERHYSSLLILYNVKTFYEDRSILKLTEEL